MKKEIREKVWNKYGRHCSYCGEEMEYHQMQVDHIEPKRNGGGNEIENLAPACRRCNKWKGTWSVEQFRTEIENQAQRLWERNGGFRLARDFQQIKINEDFPVIFYFEKMAKACRSIDPLHERIKKR
jgi:hypothetical protein